MGLNDFWECRELKVSPMGLDEFLGKSRIEKLAPWGSMDFGDIEN